MRRANVRSVTCISLLALAGSLLAPRALADRIARLHTAGAGADSDKLALDAATDAALHQLGHTTATAAEVLQGEGAAGDLAGTSKGLVAIGQTTGSDWVVLATIVSKSSAGTTRVEVEACQVST